MALRALSLSLLLGELSTTICTLQIPNKAPAPTAHAQFGGYNPGGGNNHNPSSSGGGRNSNNSGFNSSFFRSFFGDGLTILTAHAVLAALAFAILFPTGGILIRLASFPRLWLIHGLFQLLAYALYIAAFGLGIYMATNLHMMSEAHVIIGIVLFVLLFFQPILGMLHHVGFKTTQRRGVWSYVHIWLGRALVTLGIVNGGLGLKLAKDTGIGRPTNGQVVAYSVVAAVIWFVYMLAAVWGEVKRARNRRPDFEKEVPAGSSTDDVVASRGSRKSRGSIYG